MSNASQDRAFTKGGTRYDPRTVRYHRRRFDGQYEVIARAAISEGSGDDRTTDWRWVTMDVQPNRVEALNSVRELRGHA